MKTSSTSRPRHRGICILLLCIAAFWAMPTGARAQTPTPNPITVIGPALRRVEIFPNDLGSLSGDLMAISADSVIPDGAHGTTATGQTTDLSTGQPGPSPTPLVIPWDPTTVAPHEFRRDVPYAQYAPPVANLLGPWTITFTNATATPPNPPVTTPSLVGVNVAPYPTDVAISGSTLNPTFTYTFPASVDGVTFQVFNKDVKTINGVPDTVYSVSFPVLVPGAGASFTLTNFTLSLGTHWAVGLRGLVRRDTTPPLDLSNHNTAAYSEKYWDFYTPSSPGTLPQLYLPSIGPNGVYFFDLTVQPNTTYYVDPAVATGFVYATGTGDPNFATVVLPTLQGSEPYTITWDNGLHTEQVLGGNIFNFLPTDPLGVSTFKVRGIDPADGLDRTSGTEFVTGLTFFAAGSFTGTMTPLTTVYITNEGSRSVSVIDPSSNTVVDTVRVGFGPVQAVLAPKGTTAYVLNAGAGTVSVVNTSTNSATATLRVGLLPSHEAVTPDGSSVYVINTSTNTVEATVRVGFDPVDVAITPNGASAYIADALANSVTVLNTATNQVVTTLSVGFLPVKTAITPNAATAYVADAGGKSISAINTATNTVIATIGVGPEPVDVLISPDGVHAYVTDAGSNSVSVINTSTNAVSATVPVGVRPVNGAIF